MGLFRNSSNKPNNCSFSGYSRSRVAVKPCIVIVILLTGSDMSVINSGPKRKNYSDHSGYSYSGIGPKERAINSPHTEDGSYDRLNLSFPSITFPQELLEVNTKFCTRLQKSLEESVASGDEVRYREIFHSPVLNECI